MKKILVFASALLSLFAADQVSSCETSYSAEEFARRVQSQKPLCKAGTLQSAYSADAGFVLEGTTYSAQAFAKELVRRHEENHFDCVEIAATCRSVMLVARLMMATKDAKLEQINLHADERFFPDKNAMLPECPK